LLMAGLAIPPAHATETDQFTLPAMPLVDVGPDMSAATLRILRAEIARLNERIDVGAPPPDPQSPSTSADEQYFATRIYEETGFGIPESTLEREFHYGTFGDRNVRFEPSPTESIYAWAYSPWPLALVFPFSPTIRVYGVDMGTDKIGHFFQQGYEYFAQFGAFRDTHPDDTVDAGAVDAAVRYGVATEQMLFGIMLTGVYSNGDLAANYAGFKFYRNLFHEVEIAGRSYAPIVQRDGNRWVLNPDRAGADLLKPYISEHLNEAYNPSKYVFSIDLLRRHVRARCGKWREKVPDFGEDSYRAHLEHNATWFGEAYGWDLPERNAVTLLECFGEPAPLLTRVRNADERTAPGALAGSSPNGGERDAAEGR